MSKKNKAQREEAKVKVKQENDSHVVKMKFTEDKTFKNPPEIHFEKDKIYEIVGADQIQRWLKRGGEIVEGEISVPEPEQNPSVITKEPEPSKETEEEKSPEEVEEKEDEDLL